MKLHIRAGAGAVALAALLALPQAAAAQEAGPAEADEVLAGPGEVVDADILRIGTRRVILRGLDAPERRQVCALEGQAWNCFGAALRMLETFFGRGEVTCYLSGPADPLGRREGICESGPDEIDAEMVRAGLALAFGDAAGDYEDEQMEALLGEQGLWALGVGFVESWVFRETMTPGGFR